MAKPRKALEKLCKDGALGSIHCSGMVLGHAFIQIHLFLDIAHELWPAKV